MGPMKIYNFVFMGILLGLTLNTNANQGGSEAAIGVASTAVTGLDAKNEMEIVQKVRSRSYSGGSDESDLKVQTQLAKPTRKIAPTIEDESEPVSDD